MKKIFLSIFLLFSFSFAQKFEFDLNAKSVHIEDGILYIKTKKNQYKKIDFKNNKIKTSNFTPQKPNFKPRRLLRSSTVSNASNNIKHAWLYQQTLSYDHEILGDAIEAKSIAVILKDDEKITYTLDKNYVFEDLRVRLHDIDEDKEDELFVIKTHVDKGASLAVYKITDKTINQVATTGHLNRTYRWLNVVGFGDFDGNGVQNIALVKTPHIGGYLTIYEYKDNQLVEKYKRYGFTNHYIGSTELDMGTVNDLDNDNIDELILLQMNTKTIKVVNYKKGRFKELLSINNTSKVNSAIIVKDLDNDGFKEIIYTLRNKKLVIYTYKFDTSK
ncbi:MAG: VCBS repeat-containing protein [Campylobacteraceae bacterium]|nr:VCBS repeat-containing protein [Campylobacteraceae bacterium]